MLPNDIEVVKNIFKEETKKIYSTIQAKKEMGLLSEQVKKTFEYYEDREIEKLTMLRRIVDFTDTIQWHELINELNRISTALETIIIKKKAI